MPAQAALQQKPWAQNPDVHSAAAAQDAPRAFLVQLPPLHEKGERQSALLLQVVLQAPVPQTYGSQAEVVTVWQVPVPLQVRAGVSVEPVQLAATQVVPLA